MVTTLTDCTTIVRSALSRVRSALGLQPAAAMAMVVPMAVAPAGRVMAVAPMPFVDASNPCSTRWFAGNDAMCGNHEGTYTAKRIHPGRLGGST